MSAVVKGGLNAPGGLASPGMNAPGVLIACSEVRGRRGELRMRSSRLCRVGASAPLERFEGGHISILLAGRSADSAIEAEPFAAELRHEHA